MTNSKSILQYIKSKAASLGQGLVYTAFLMFYAWRNPDTPTWAKRVIMGALAYLVAPIDAIPDLTPFIGFTDDLSVLSISLMSIAYYVNDEVKSKAKEAMNKHFKSVDVKSISDIDEKL